MAQWGRNDQSVTVTTSTNHETSNGAPIGTYALVKSGGGDYAHQGNTHGTRANSDKTLFGNTTVSAFIDNVAVGVFGVDATEAAGVDGGPIAETYLTYAGTGYGPSKPVVTITATNGGTSGVVNTNVITTSGVNRGRITALNIQTAGSGYITNPTMTIAAPPLIVFNGNSAVTNAADTIDITSANSKFQVGDGITYAGNVTSTPVGLTDNTKYYVSFANSTVLALSATLGGSNVNISKATGDNTTAGSATLQGETATGYVVSGGNKGVGITHAGWVLRTEGTGGRAGRVQYETLVAMGSLGAQTAAYGTAALVADASDDAILPNS
jgi:hypothetical protein